MALAIPPSLVTGAQREAFPYGLFSVAVPREGTQDRFENGVEFEALTCEPAQGIASWDCIDPDDEDASITGLPKTLDAAPTVGEGSEFTIYGNFKCTPVGWTPAAAQSAATQHLINREEARVEQALWSGDLDNNPNFTSATNLGAFTAAEALAELEDVLASEYGSQGVIHLSRGNALRLLTKGALEARGGRLYTKLGTPTVAGAGYGLDQIVATPAMFIYRSEVFTSSNIAGDLLDRGQNNLHAIAERTYVVGFDPCGIWRAEVVASSNGQGPPGLSAYEVAVENGFEGDEEAWLESLKGADGADGEQGIQGPPGADGEQGIQGIQGPPGENGADGADGDPGVVQSIIAGDGIDVDDTDPANPVVSIPN